MALALRNAFAVYLLWAGATYLLEGLPGTLARPEAVGLRLAYALVANLALGIALPLAAIRMSLRRGVGVPQDYGFAGARRALASAALAAIAGYGLFRLQAGPVPAPVLLNIFAQAWVVTLAEIIVCWALVGASVHLALRSWHRIGAVLVAATTASVLFGAYHFAHSPPFNTPSMAAFLALIGLATSLWWFASRELYGSAVLHNFFGVTGVLAALQAGGLVPGEPRVALPLVVTALAVSGVLIGAHLRWFRARA